MRGRDGVWNRVSHLRSGITLIQIK